MTGCAPNYIHRHKYHGAVTNMYWGQMTILWSSFFLLLSGLQWPEVTGLAQHVPSSVSHPPWSYMDLKKPNSTKLFYLVVLGQLCERKGHELTRNLEDGKDVKTLSVSGRRHWKVLDRRIWSSRKLIERSDPLEGHDRSCFDRMLSWWQNFL